MLAEAMCKHMGFTYAPSQDPAEYWRHGYSSERDFIFVTTANVTHDQLRAISEDVGPERTLLVCCKAFNARADAFENLTVKKIPQAVLSRCEWGRDDYSLRIAEAPPPPEDTAASGDPRGGPAQARTARRGRKHGTIAVLGHGREGRRQVTDDRLLRQISARLSLRRPQEQSLGILADVLGRTTLAKDADPAAALAAIQAAYPNVAEFERDFPSLCFALATGVGKTRLMGAFIAYLTLSGRSRHFFVLAPNTTIYEKLVAGLLSRPARNTCSRALPSSRRSRRCW